jgi:beta-fructofuranosidase
MSCLYITLSDAAERNNIIMKRLKYHFEPRKGWMNDPNGLIDFNGTYHAFFQHNPYDTKWGPMHWGHAVSNDLVHWDEQDIALYPDQNYEDNGGCFSGSAIEKDGKMYLFYTSVSKAFGQAQSLAVSSDGKKFEKFSGNPIIPKYPKDGSPDFRDPKVTLIDGVYYMVCGSGKDHVGKVLLFTSADLINWKYIGVLFEDSDCGDVLECPDFFKLNGRYVLMFSKMDQKTYSTQFVIGDFDGSHFSETSRCQPEGGPQFYAPQTFCDHKGRRIMIGWLYDWSKKLDTGAESAGALTIPRVLSLVDDRIYDFPVEEAFGLLRSNDEDIVIQGSSVCINNDITFTCDEDIKSVMILKDTKTVEIFINNGRYSFSYWFNS